MRPESYPDVVELRRLMGQAMGVPVTQKRLTELIGCSMRSLIRWEKGERPALAFQPRLRELDQMLRSGKFSVVKALETKPDRPRAPLVASGVSVTLEGTQALLRFVLAVPGESVERSVVEIVVPQEALSMPLFKCPRATAQVACHSPIPEASERPQRTARARS